MTIALPLAWTGIVLAAIDLAWVAWLDWESKHRMDDLSEALDLAHDDLDKAVVRISYLEDALRDARLAAVMPPEPPTAPIRVAGHPQSGTGRMKGSDTAPAEAVIDAGLREFSGATASGYGRHAAREAR